MKKFTKISLILCAVLAGAGVLICIVGGTLGFGFGHFVSMAEQGYFNLVWEDDGLYWERDFSLDELGETDDLSEENKEWPPYGDDWQEEGGTLEERTNGQEEDWTPVLGSWEADTIKNIDIDYEFGTLRIVPSDSGRLEVEGAYCPRRQGAERRIEVNVEGDTLQIKDSFFKKNAKVLRPKDAIVILRLPAERNFKEVKIDAAAASVELHTKLISDKMDLSIGAGELVSYGEESSLIQAKELKLAVGAGHMKLGEVWAEQLRLDCGVGQLELLKVTAADTGADCGLGQLIMKMTGRQTDYDYEIASALGEVIVGDASYNGLGTSQKVDNGGENFIEMNCGIGSMEVYFAE